MTSFGIDIGTTKSCFGYEEDGTIKIIENSLEEEIIPSIVSIKEEKIKVGEDAVNYRTTNCNSTISEFKRIIGVDYSKTNLRFLNYKNHLCYQLTEEENAPVSIKFKNNKYAPEEIYAYIVKKAKENAFNSNLSLKRMVMTVPACFGITKRRCIKRAAEAELIKELKKGPHLEIINESSAAAIAYEYYNLVNEQKTNYKYDIYNNFGNLNPVPSLTIQDKLILVFDLGGGFFDLSLISVEKKTNKLILDVKSTLGSPNLGGIDFDNKLVDYCIKEFCNQVSINENIIYQNKKVIQILKMKCEIAKKLLDSKDSVVINENNIYNNEDLFFKISREDFDRICNDLFKEIEYKLNKILKISNVSPDNVNEILLIGGASKIPKVKQIVKNKFKNSTIIDNLDKNKIVAYGAVLYSCEKNKSIILNETIPYSLGISIGNNDPISYINHGDKMYKIIKQNSKMPITVSREFRIKNVDNKTFKLYIYEGNNKYIKYNKKIGEIDLNLEKAQIGTEINFNILFSLDIDYILNVKVEIPSLRINIEKKIGKSEDILKIKSLESNDKISELSEHKKELKDYSSNIDKIEEKNKESVLKNCCECCDDILIKYKQNYEKEDAIEDIYNIINELFGYYIEKLKIKNKKVNDNKEIISKIKEKMKYLIDYFGYLENLLGLFTSIHKFDKNIFFEIVINYIELMNNEGINILKKKNKTKNYCAKIYFENCKNTLSKYINEEELNSLDIKEELKIMYNVQKKINQFVLESFNSKNKENNPINLEDLKNQINSIKTNEKKWLTDTLSLIEALQSNII